MSNRKPHNDYAGYVFERKHDGLGGHLVCLVAEEQGIDAEDKYIVVLEPQSALGPSFPSIPKARDFVRDEIAGESGYDWNL